MRMQLRLAGLRKDEFGWLATFYGKPDIQGNFITVPIDEKIAAELEPNEQYIFVLEGVA